MEGTGALLLQPEQLQVGMLQVSVAASSHVGMPAWLEAEWQASLSAGPVSRVRAGGMITMKAVTAQVLLAEGGLLAGCMLVTHL